VRNNYQREVRKSNHKLEVVRGQELLVRVPLPMAEVWAEMQAQVEELTGQAGMQILRATLDEEVTRRVGPPHRPNPRGGGVRWGKTTRICSLWRTEDCAGTTTGTNSRRARGGTFELRAPATVRACNMLWDPRGRRANLKAAVLAECAKEYSLQLLLHAYLVLRRSWKT